MMDDTAERAQRARTICPYLTTKETAFHLRLAPSTLKDMRGQGRGPRCELHGRAYYYHIDDIESWAKARRKGGGHD